MTNQENIESSSETQVATEKAEFNDSEQARIKELTAELYDSSQQYIGDSESEDIQKVRNELTLLNCDTSRAHDLGPGITPEEYAATVIGRGKTKASGEYKNSEGNIEKLSQQETLVMTKDLTDKTPTEINSQESRINIAQSDGAENKLIAEVYSEDGVLVGKTELIKGENSIDRPAENEIIINVREISETTAIIEFSQKGVNLKKINNFQ